MSMTNKDYKVIADALAQARRDLTVDESPVADLITSYITSSLNMRYTNFDSIKFMLAANYHKQPQHASDCPCEECAERGSGRSWI